MSVAVLKFSSSAWDLDDGPNCEPHSDGKILGPRGRKFRDVCHYGADSRPVTLSASNKGSSGNDQASISTSQAISGAFGRGAVSGCRRQPRHVRVRRQACCSVPFRRRMAGGQGHLRSHRAGPLLAARGHLAKSRGGLPAVARHANCLLRQLVAAIGSTGGTLARPVTRRWRATAATLTKGQPLACFVAAQAREGWRSAGGYLRAIVGIDDAQANRPDAHLRLRKPPPGRGRGVADGAMTSVGLSSSATSGESRSPLMSAANNRSISAKPARSRRT